MVRSFLTPPRLVSFGVGATRLTGRVELTLGLVTVGTQENQDAENHESTYPPPLATRKFQNRPLGRTDA